eukprot:2270909-Amphidinium_carterae.1
MFGEDAPASTSINTESSTGKRCREITSDDTRACKASKSPEVSSSTTWAKRLHAALLEARQSRGLQNAPVLVGSVCSGMGTHHMALQDCMRFNASLAQACGNRLLYKPCL